MKIVLGIDDSPFSEEVVRYVAAAQWLASAQFVVVSIFARPVVTGREDEEPAVIVQKLLGEREKLTKGLAVKAAAKLERAGLRAQPRVGSGDPRFVLVETAVRERADLIVVGTHGRTGVRRLLLGSVASHVVTHAPCSVLVVRRPRRAGTR